MATAEYTDSIDCREYAKRMVTKATGTNAKQKKLRKQPEGSVEQPDTSKHADPSGRLPKWAKPQPGETIIQYRDRLELSYALDSMQRSMGGDTAAHAKWRECGMKGLGMGQRIEVDVTARQDTSALAALTPEELRAIREIHQRALARTQDVVVKQIADHTDDGENSQAISNYVIPVDSQGHGNQT